VRCRGIRHLRSRRLLHARQGDWIDWLIEWLIDWSVKGDLMDWLMIEFLIDWWLNFYLIDRSKVIGFIDWMFDWLIGHWNELALLRGIFLFSVKSSFDRHLSFFRRCTLCFDVCLISFPIIFSSLVSGIFSWQGNKYH
jgi:hypothetical protein